MISLRNRNKEGGSVLFTTVSNQTQTDRKNQVIKYYSQKKELANKHRKMLTASVSISTDFDGIGQQAIPEVLSQFRPEIFSRSRAVTPVQKFSIQIEKNTQKVRSLIENKKHLRNSEMFHEYLNESLGPNRLISSRMSHWRHSSMIQPELDSLFRASPDITLYRDVNRFLGRKLISHKLPVFTCELEYKYIPLSQTRKYITTPHKRHEKRSVSEQVNK